MRTRSPAEGIPGDPSDAPPAVTPFSREGLGREARRAQSADGFELRTLLGGEAHKVRAFDALSSVTHCGLTAEDSEATIPAMRGNAGDRAGAALWERRRGAPDRIKGLFRSRVDIQRTARTAQPRSSADRIAIEPLVSAPSTAPVTAGGPT